MKLFRDLKIRTKFLLIPLVVAIGTTLVASLYLSILDARQAKLSHVVQHDLAEIKQLTTVFSQLSTNHVQIFDLLATATRSTAEQLYEIGKIRLHLIHNLIGQFNAATQTFRVTEQERAIQKKLREELFRYRDATITAIEMASVDVALATQYMIKANQSYSEVNRDFLSLLNMARQDSNTAITGVLHEFDHDVAQFRVLVGLTVLSLVVLTLLVANLLTHEIVSLTGIMAKVVRGDKRVEVPYVARRDEIGILAQGLQRFQQSLLQLTASEVATTALNQKLAKEVEERHQAQEALQRLNENLEKQVQERTDELRQKIAQLEETEVALRMAKEEAELGNRAKSQFLANMSHELRTPLNAVLGYTQILTREGGLSLRQEKAVAIIEQSGEHLLGLINELLDTARIEAGILELHPVECDLPRLLQGIAESVRVRAEAKRLSFTVEQLGDLPAVVRADQRRLRQVLINLLDNAIKYTATGGVTLTVESHDNRLRVAVADTGMGIPPAQLPHIFDAFYQVRNGQAFVEGTGLGLAISKRLVGLMGGTLDVRSTPGEGSVFSFELSLAVVTTALVSADRGRRIISVSGMKPKVLVVDDDPANRQLLSDMLTPLGFLLQEAGDGQAALTYATAWRPNAILMDMRMQVMDGFEAIRRIRASEELRDVVILAVSASVFEHNRRQCLEAGADDFLRKPCRLEELTDLLRRHLGLEWIYDQEDSRAQEIEAPPSPLPLPESERTILLDLARRGDIKRILATADRLTQDDPRYAPVLHEVRMLAKGCEVKRLRRLLEAVQPAAASALP